MFLVEKYSDEAEFGRVKLDGGEKILEHSFKQSLALTE